MCDYSQSKIYKVFSPSKNITYYGSTTKDLQKRLINHIRKYKYYKDGKANYVSVNDVLECQDAVIELVENFSCNNRKELADREGYYIKNNECINKNIPGRTYEEWKLEHKDYNKEYYEDNKDYYKQYSKDYYNDNKDKLKEYSKEYRTNNKDYYNNYRKTYYEDNKDYYKQYHKEKYKKVKEKKEENRKANKEYILEIQKEINNDHKQYMRNYMKTYYQKHKDKISTYYREKYRTHHSIASKIEKPVIEIVKSNIVKL